MSEQNKALVRRWFEEVWNQRREEAIDELLSADSAVEGLGETVIRGPAEFKPFHRAFLSTFRDVDIQVVDMVAEGDKVAVRCRGRLTMPDGRAGTVEGGGIVRIRDGQIVEGWNQWSFLELMEQMGRVPSGSLMQALAGAAEEQAGGHPGA